MEASGADVEQVAADFSEDGFTDIEETEHVAPCNSGHFAMLIDAAVDNQARIDRAVDTALKKGWPLGKIDPTLRALFRAASAELIGGKAPAKVVISEFLEIADAFHPDGKSTRLANGVLDSLARSFRPTEFE